LLFGKRKKRSKSWHPTGYRKGNWNILQATVLGYLPVIEYRFDMILINLAMLEGQHRLQERDRGRLWTRLSLSNAATAPPGAISRRPRRVPLTWRSWQDFTNMSQSGAEANLQMHLY
jgi:hypothetical protein